MKPFHFSIRRSFDTMNVKENIRRMQVPLNFADFDIETINLSPRNETKSQAPKWAHKPKKVRNVLKEDRSCSPLSETEAMGDVHASDVQNIPGAQIEKEVTTVEPFTYSEVETKHLEKKLVRKLKEIKKKKEITIAHLDDAVRKFSSIDARRNGIGSRGGHIAREQKDPGPHNGHFPPAYDHLFLATTPMKLPKVQLYSKEPLIQPEWDHRFIEGKLLSVEKDNMIPVLDSNSSIVDDNRSRPSTTESSSRNRGSRVSLFRREISRFRESNKRRYQISASDPSMQPRSHTAPSSSGGVDFDFNLVPSPTPAAPQQHKASSVDRNYRKRLGSDPHYPNWVLRGRIPLITIASKLWETLMSEARESAFDVLSSDLLEIHQYKTPPSVVVSVMGFISILLGLDPTWETAKTMVLSNFKLLTTYIREVNEILSLKNC